MNGACTTFRSAGACPPPPKLKRRLDRLNTGSFCSIHISLAQSTDPRTVGDILHHRAELNPGAIKRTITYLSQTISYLSLHQAARRGLSRALAHTASP